MRGDEIAATVQRWSKMVNDALDQLLPPEREVPVALHRAMRYAVLQGGGRIRPVLVLAAASLGDAPEGAAVVGACALELVHAYSLVHDDLPCMDDSDYRRGLPSCHRAFGEGMAVLAGTALLSLSFQLCAKQLVERGISPQRALGVLVELGRACGSRGVMGGQALDLQARGRPVSADMMELMHRLKTARLFEAAVVIGAELGGLDEGARAALREYGHRLGMGYQTLDDLEDWREEAPGEEPNLRALYSEEQCWDRARSWMEQAAERARTLGKGAEFLVTFPLWLYRRARARRGEPSGAV